MEADRCRHVGGAADARAGRVEPGGRGLGRRSLRAVAVRRGGRRRAGDALALGHAARRARVREPAARVGVRQPRRAGDGRAREGRRCDAGDRARPARGGAAGRVVTGALDRRALGVLGAGHLCIDLCQGAVPALLPFLASERGYSYAALGALVLFSTIGSSIVQPLFGILSDRVARPWLMPAGLATAGTGIALAGVAPSYGLLAAAVVVSGLGVAM